MTDYDQDSRSRNRGSFIVIFIEANLPTPINPLGIHSISACTGCGDSGNRMGRRKIFSKKWLGEEPKEKKSTAMGFFQAVYAIGITTFPMFTGSIVSAGGMESGYLVLAGIAILGIIIAKVYYIQETCRGI